MNCVAKRWCAVFSLAMSIGTYGAEQIDPIMSVDATIPYKIIPTSTNMPYAVAFDLDGVLFKKPAKLSTGLTVATSISPLYWPAAFQRVLSLGQGSVLTWAQFCYQNGAVAGGDALKKMVLSTPVYRTTQELMTWLDDRGYKIFLASNQDKREIALQIAHRSELYDLAHRFTDGIRIDSFAGQPVIQKPDAAYFQQLKTIMRSHCTADTRLIFIDDKKANVEAAQCQGFIGVTCTNPEKLYEQLQEVGIPCPAPSRPAQFSSALPTQHDRVAYFKNGMISLAPCAALIAASCIAIHLLMQKSRRVIF